MQMVRRAKAAIQRGDSAVVVGAPGSSMEQYANELSVPYRSIRLFFEYVDIHAAWKLCRIFEDEKADSCIVGITRHLSIAIIAKKMWRQSLDIVLFQQMISGLRKIDFFHNWVYRNVTSAIVPTMLMAALLCSSTIFPEEKIDVIPYAVDIDEVDCSTYDSSSEKEHFGLPQDKLIVGHTARFDRLKDQETLIRAFAKASISNSFLVLAGDGDPNYRSEMQRLTEELGIQTSVKFLPFTLRFGALLSCIDIYVMSSLCETFSLALIQAMVAGKPVVGTNSGGTPEAIIPERNGFLFEPRDTNVLSSLLQKLTTDGSLRDRLALQARVDARVRYDSRKVDELFFRSCVKGIKNDRGEMHLVSHRLRTTV